MRWNGRGGSRARGALLQSPAPLGGNGNGLLFPANGVAPASAFIALQFLNPHLDGLPLWGPSGQGVTVVWRVRVFQHTGFHTFMFHAQGSGVFSAGNGYWGMQPWPPGGSSGATHQWEIAIAGADRVNNLSGAPVAVVKDATYVQAVRVQRNDPNSKTLQYLINLPATDNANVIEWTEVQTGYGETTASPAPALTIGDAPWAQGQERMNGIWFEYKVFNTLLSLADTVAEGGDLSRIVTAAGNANIWYGKNGYDSVDDLACDYGTGRAPVWADANNKATLWTP